MDDKYLSPEEDIRNLAVSLINPLGICSFRLIKWLSNSHNVLSSLPTSELSPKIVNLDLSSQPIKRVLGMSWDTEHDTFVLKTIEKDRPVIKPAILSSVSYIFELLGILAP